MDDTTSLQLLSAILLENGPGGVVFIALLGSLTAWWRSVSRHLCEAIPQALSILGKFADHGVRIHLTVNLIEEDKE